MEAVSSEDVSSPASDNLQDNVEAPEHEEAEPDLESQFDREYFTDPRTGRNRQILICH